MALAGLDHLEAGGAQQILRMGPDLLSVLQRAGGMVGDPQRRGVARLLEPELGTSTNRDLGLETEA